MQERERSTEQRQQQDITEEMTRPEGMSDEAEREQQDMRRNQPSGPARKAAASDAAAELSRTGDQRMQHGETRRQEEEDAGGAGAAPYDEAPPGTPEEQVIEKGERERPGPTESRGDGTD